MAIYAIGDVQGCCDELEALLEGIQYDASKDKLWFAGDLVNRGPKSLETLRLIRSLNAVVVLGNHDLHLLACAHLPKHRKRKDTLDHIFSAEDGPELLDWLRHQSLMHHDTETGYSMIHAGLSPQWDLETALSCAKEVEQILQSDHCLEFFDVMYGNEPNAWLDTLEGIDRIRFIVNCFTRLRYCDADGNSELEYKGTPNDHTNNVVPWFKHPDRKSRDLNILFGHWSTLGRIDTDGVHSLDTGCVWGGELTAMRIGEQPMRFEYDCPGAQQPDAK